MAKVPFRSIFTVNTDGSIVTTQATRIGGIQVPQGFHITRGTVFNGFDISQYVEHDLEVVVDNGVNVITGIY